MFDKLKNKLAQGLSKKAIKNLIEIIQRSGMGFVFVVFEFDKPSRAQFITNGKDKDVADMLNKLVQTIDSNPQENQNHQETIH